jgi:hypothetical protein
VPIFIDRGAPFYARGRWRIQICVRIRAGIPDATLFRALVDGRWNMALKVLSVVQDACDFDRPFWRHPVHQEATIAMAIVRRARFASEGLLALSLLAGSAGRP